MNGYDFDFSGASLTALPSGALWWGAQNILTVSDLHLGKSDRAARRSGTMLPPYEFHDTLSRLQSDIDLTNPSTVICLGDSFDDLTSANNLTEQQTQWISQLQAGRRWIWIEGNHDPGPLQLGGTHLAKYSTGPLTYYHIAEPTCTGEISGHYHPKATLHSRGTTLTRPCFLIDTTRVILPAYGTYTGGLRSTSPELTDLMKPNARAVLTGSTPLVIPMPRHPQGALRP